MRRELAGVTLVLAIHSFATGLVNVFVPFLLMQSGFRLWQVCLFYVVYSATKLVVEFPVIRFINRYGARPGFAGGLVFAAAYLLALGSFLQHGWIIGLYLAPVLLAIEIAFIWDTKNYEMARSLVAATRGRDVAFVSMIGKFSALVAPLAGGIVVLAVNEQALSYVAILTLALAVVPLRHVDRRSSHVVEARLPLTFAGVSRRDLFANFCFNSHNMVALYVWPIYLAVVIGSVVSIGAVITAASLLSFGLMFVAGRRSDSGRNMLALLEGTAATSLAHVARLFVVSPVAVTFVGAFYNVALNYQLVPWSSRYFAKCREKGLAYVLAMELAGDLANLALWTTLLAFAWLAPEPRSFLDVAFVLAAMVTWGCLAVSRHVEEEGTLDSGVPAAPSGPGS